MAMKKLLHVPGMQAVIANAYTTLDAENEQVAHCGFWVPGDGVARTITHICWSVFLKTTNGTVTCSLETIDAATGLPAGVIAGKTGNEAVTAAGYFETALGASYTLPAAGAWLAVTFKIGTPGNLGVFEALILQQNILNGNWVCADLGGAGWAKKIGASTSALKTSTGEYILPLGTGVFVSNSSTSISTVPTNPKYVGNRITTEQARRISGFMLIRMDTDVDYSVKLCDATGTVLKGDDGTIDMAVTVDSEYRTSTSASLISMIPFPSKKTLAANTNYYLMFFPESGTNLGVSFANYPTEAIMKQGVEIPEDITLRAATAPDGWDGAEDITETATRLYVLLPVLDGIDIPTDAEVAQAVWEYANRELTA